MRAIFFLLAAMVLGLTGGYAWSTWSKPSAAAAFNTRTAPSAKPGQTSAEIEQTAYYATCAAARDAGQAPLMSGQPGYREELDPDGDGIACQPGSAG
jgi:hypothetical protein